ncbi:dienelactone hydrolase family protein [Candidatus Parabeggiatoa sp. HSG14]|uniref:dienelactone hydrolase family protein n=1 Tax=Candidatus Parabeggiatoa sp. HSG14 TaxID=3055593 RepID=UPI0025A692CF|nr:dienelactone hydrolase family protein [Thiotrichales bacterium HSG14]
MIHFLRYLFVLLLFVSLPSYAVVKGEQVDYTADGVTLKGYFAYDDSIKGKRPGVLVVHEWWGHNEYARKRTRMLAELGYAALAVDMYGDGKIASHPNEAKKFMMEVIKNMDKGKARFVAALDILKKQKTVNPDKMAAIGYCFGGGVVLGMARAGVNLAGVASFHGSLATKNPAQLGKVKAKVLVLHGNDDQFIPPQQVKVFKEEMENAKVDFEFVGYPNVIHSFTNPDANLFAKKFNLALAYDAVADKASWEKLQTFFKQIFADQK